MASRDVDVLIPAKDREQESVFVDVESKHETERLKMKYWRSVEPSDLETEKVLWNIPFAYGLSVVKATEEYEPIFQQVTTQTHDTTTTTTTTTRMSEKKIHLHDIIEIPIFDDPNGINFKKYARSLKQIFDNGKKLPFDQFNMQANIDFHNMIIYIPEITNKLEGFLTLPNTTIAILGKVITDLLSKNKALIVLDAKGNKPITNLVFEALERAKLEAKDLTPRIRKRLNFLGLYDKPLARDMNPEVREDLGKRRYQLSKDGCRELVKKMASPATSKVLEGCVILSHDQENSKLLKEHLLFELSQILKIPALKLEFLVEEGKKTCYKIRIEYLDPYYREQHNRSVYNFYRKEPELYQMILEKADDYFYRNNESAEGWNTMITALFLQDQMRVRRALGTGDSPKDISQIDRVMRYALFYGSREIVEDIFNNIVIQECLVSQRENTLTSVFKKSGTELILFQRLMYALTGQTDYIANQIRIANDDFTASLEVVKFLQIAIEKIMGDGFLWNIPDVQKHDELHSLTHYEIYFTEYIMVWGVLSQRYEVAELFLEYSGVHLQELLTTDCGFYRTRKGVFQIANALAISRLLYGVENQLRFDSAVSTDDRETLLRKAGYFEELAVSLLDNAIGKNEFTLNELFETKMPFWNNSTAIEIASSAGDQLFFTHEGVQGHVRNVWNGIAKLQEIYQDSDDQNININILLKRSFRRPWKQSSITFFYNYYISPKTTFYIHALFYFLFLVLYTVHFLVAWSPSPYNGYLTFDVVYFLYMSAYILDEVFQYRYLIEDKSKGKRVKHNQWLKILKSAMVEYLSSGWNILDILIAISFVATITLRITVFVLEFENPTGDFAVQFNNITRLVYGLVAVLFYIRFFQYVLVFRGLGPLIYTCYIAFKRMLKFLVIFLLVSLGFGVVEVTLTSPSQSGFSLLRVLLFSPIYQIFGEFNLETVQMDSISYVNGTENGFWNSTAALAFSCVILLQLIANVLLLNLMIAYFTKIFEEISENADSIYLTQFLEVVDEYRRKSFFPPPFNLLVYLIRTFGICKTVCVEFFEERDSKIEEEIERDTHFNRAKVYPVFFGHHNENGFADEYWRNREQIRIRESIVTNKRQKRVDLYTLKSNELVAERKYTVF